MQSAKVLGSDRPEVGTLGLGDLELQGRRLPRAVSARESTGAPGAAAVDLVEAHELGRGLGVAERHVDEAVVGQSAHGGDGRGLLAAAEGAGGDEEAGQLAVVQAVGPLSAGAVPEGLPLRGEVAVAGGNAHQDGVVLLQLLGAFGALQEGHVSGLAGGAHGGEGLLGESLGDLVKVGLAAGLLDTLLLGLRQLADVAVHGVLSI